MRGEEPPVDHVVEDGEKGIVVAGDVEEAAGFGVLAELRPRQDLEASKGCASN